MFEEETQDEQDNSDLNPAGSHYPEGFTNEELY